MDARWSRCPEVVYVRLVRKPPHRCIPTPMEILVEFELVEHVWRVVGAALASCVHLAGVVPLDAALLITPKCIPGQIRVLVVEIALGTVCLLRRWSL